MKAIGILSIIAIIMAGISLVFSFMTMKEVSEVQQIVMALVDPGPGQPSGPGPGIGPSGPGGGIGRVGPRGGPGTTR